MFTAYCKFSNAPVAVKTTRNPWKSPSGDYPVLVHAGVKETDLFRMIDCLRKSDYDLDQMLTSTQSADAVALIALLEEKLLPAYLHLWWVDARIYTEVTRPWFAKALGLPWSLYLPAKRRNDVISRLNAPFVTDRIFSETDLEIVVTRDAKECLNMLSTKLGSNEYFFGNKPTTLDAIVFGYVAPLLKMPMVNPLQTHIKACHNLVNFCQRIISVHFPLSPEELETQRKVAEQERQHTAELSDFPHSRRNLFLAGVVAVAAMASYALLSGLVQIEFVNVNKGSTDSADNDADEGRDSSDS